MPLFGKGKSKNPPPLPRPDYVPRDPEDEPLYRPPELLQSYLEPPVNAVGPATNLGPTATKINSSSSLVFAQNDLSYEADGNLVGSQIVGLHPVAPSVGSHLVGPHKNPAAVLRPRTSGATTYLDSSHAQLQQNQSLQDNQSTLSVKANDSFIIEGFNAPCRRDPLSVHNAIPGDAQLQPQPLPRSQFQWQLQNPAQRPPFNIRAKRPTVDANYSDPKDACKLRQMAPTGGPLTHSQSFPLQLGSFPGFDVGADGLFRAGAESLTVSDPESGVFSAFQLQNMDCDDDEEYDYSKPYEPQILQDFLRKVRRDDEIEAASAAASAASSKLASPQSPSAAQPISNDDDDDDDNDPDVYCDPTKAFAEPPDHASTNKETTDQRLANHLPRFDAGFKADGRPSNSQRLSLGLELSGAQPLVKSVAPLPTLKESSPVCTCDEDSLSSPSNSSRSPNPVRGVEDPPAQEGPIEDYEQPWDFRHPNGLVGVMTSAIENLNVSGPTPTARPTPAPRSTLANPDVEAMKATSPPSSRYSTPSGDSQAGNQTYEEPWDSVAKQREIEERLMNKRAPINALPVEARVSPLGGSDASGVRTSTSSEATDAAFNSPAKFSSNFSSAGQIALHPVAQLASNSDSNISAHLTGVEKSHSLDLPSVFWGSGEKSSGNVQAHPFYQSPPSSKQVGTHLPGFFPSGAQLVQSFASAASQQQPQPSNVETPGFPASQTGPSLLTLSTEIPLDPSPTRDSRPTKPTFVATDLRSNNDHLRSFANPVLLQNNNNNNNNHIDQSEMSKKAFVSGSESSKVGEPVKAQGDVTAPKVSAPVEYDRPTNGQPVKVEGETKTVISSRSPRKPPNLHLDLGCSALNARAEAVNPSLPLRQQNWFHGSISRSEAERLLSVHKEGSYLVRQSESKKEDYSLSLRSAKGFMHMKIVRQDGKYILGQFSQPYNSIPEMIHHYSKNKLPIKGATHMSLLHPIKDDLL